MEIALITAAALLGLYGNRVRGGLYHFPADIYARVLGSLIGFGVVAWMAGTGRWSIMVMALGVVGDMLAGADGNYEVNWTFSDMLRFWIYAIERLAPLGIGLALYARFTGGDPMASTWLVPAVVVCPACYGLARYWPIAVPWLGIKARDGADSGFGEAAFGAVCGVLTLVACHGV